jgi:hypothetical protein
MNGGGRSDEKRRSSFTSQLKIVIEVDVTRDRWNKS